jgi:hypothetical protein
MLANPYMGQRNRMLASLSSRPTINPPIFFGFALITVRKWWFCWGSAVFAWIFQAKELGPIASCVDRLFDMTFCLSIRTWPF